MEIAAVGHAARAVPSPNAGKGVTVRARKYYSEQTNQIYVGEVVRETDQYLVLRGYVISYRKGEKQAQRDEEGVRWVPWTQIAVVSELPSGVKWRDTQMELDESGKLRLR